MFLACVRVMLKRSVLDPQGVTVMGALKSLGFDTVSDVRVGKYFQIAIEAPTPDEARLAVDEMCRKLLSNPVIEQYDFDIVAGGAGK